MLRSSVGLTALEPAGTGSGTEPITLLSGLLEASRLLGGDADPDSLYWRVVETILQASGADACALALESDSEERLALRTRDGIVRRAIPRGRSLGVTAIGAAVFRDGAMRVVRDIPGEAEGDLPAYVARYGFQSCVVLPVQGKAGIAGVLSIYSTEAGGPGEPSMSALVLVNQVASVAIENAALYQRLQRSYFSTTEALASAIDAASPATHGHSKRVTQFALILGESVGLRPAAMTTLKYGALLHDIGKLGVPAAILEKEGALTPAEFETVREHPAIGERIIAPVDFLQPARPIVRHHHERWDGQGYPDRLRGEEIPLGARIVALADFYDAMVSARPYKQAFDPRQVADEIRASSGKRFDPDLTDGFLRMTEAARTPVAHR